MLRSNWSNRNFLAIQQQRNAVDPSSRLLLVRVQHLCRGSFGEIQTVVANVASFPALSRMASSASPVPGIVACRIRFGGWWLGNALRVDVDAASSIVTAPAPAE